VRNQTIIIQESFFVQPGPLGYAEVAERIRRRIDDISAAAVTLGVPCRYAIAFNCNDEKYIVTVTLSEPRFDNQLKFPFDLDVDSGDESPCTPVIPAAQPAVWEGQVF